MPFCQTSLFFPCLRSDFQKKLCERKINIEKKIGKNAIMTEFSFLKISLTTLVFLKMKKKKSCN